MNIETPVYSAGYKAKVDEIAKCGWEAARDEFNRVYPPGRAWTGSQEGLAYARGEYKALCDTMNRRCA
ncbi:hypothetical protein [Burkholderia cepacia]|uniref:hypothetical protein n=1 Tax=Burkholderia cepacia TaxID=292 RepID=UPI001F1B4C9A|nr:hypothetical protein [Burkholderia cepacia]UIY58140.1 hypothetical protein LZ568_07970 [Burkholderia cepacia]